VLAALALSSCTRSPGTSSSNPADPPAAAPARPRGVHGDAGRGASGPDPGFLRAFAETRGFLLGRPTRIKVTPDGSAVLFLRSPGREPTLALYEYDVATGQTRELITPAQLLQGKAETLSVAEAARRERQRIVDRGFATYDLSRDGKLVLLPLSGRIYIYDREGPQAGRVRVVGDGKEPVIDPRLSPDGRKIAFVRDNELYVAEIDTGRERALTRGGSDNLTHGLAEFVAQEEMDRHEGYFWSPDSAQLAYTEVDQSAVDRFTIADPAHPEKPANVFPYPRAGKTNAQVRLGIIAAAGGRTTWVKWDADRYPYLARVVWRESQAPLCVLVQTRDQREAAFLAVDPRTGATRTLHVEKDEAWVELDRDLPRWLPDGRGYLVASEQSGQRALELHKKDGSLDKVLLPAAFHSLVEVTDDADKVMATTAKPTSTRLWQISLSAATAATEALSPDEVAEHTAVFARNGSVYVDTSTNAAALPETVVYQRAAAGEKSAWRRLGVLPAVAVQPPFAANLQLTSTSGADGRHFDAALVRPRQFVAGRKYPVIVSVYGGPTSLTVRADQRNYLMAQWIADHGAIVVSIDNRGTPRRDRTWSRAIKGNFAEIPLADQIEGLRGLGREHHELDLDRVGIYGWSFGGYMSALAVLKRPDVFRVGVAGAPVVDWRDYDTHYTERYLDLPATNPRGYDDSSLIPLAKNLSRPLLLIHGTGDDNVYFFHSLKLGNALFRAGRPFDFLPLSVTHQVPDPVVREQLWGRIAKYLMDHLAPQAPAPAH
jgi:dipeptidyl-peptidase 4